MESQRDDSGFFALSLRQRRLRVATLALLAVIVAMILVGIWHPFFHPARTSVISPEVRKAVAVRALIVGGWWATCLILAALLPLLAYLDVREIRRKVALARRDYWREIAQDSAERRGAGPASGGADASAPQDESPRNP